MNKICKINFTKIKSSAIIYLVNLINKLSFGLNLFVISMEYNFNIMW